MNELAEWKAAWKAFYDAWKTLRKIAKRDGHLLTMDVKLKENGLRKRNKSDDLVSENTGKQA